MFFTNFKVNYNNKGNATPRLTLWAFVPSFSKIPWKWHPSHAETSGSSIFDIIIFRAFLLLYQLTISKPRICCSCWRVTLYRPQRFATSSNKPTVTVLLYLHVLLVIKYTFTSRQKSHHCVWHYTGSFFYRSNEHHSCHQMSLQMRASCTI
jgi:hypothetical protein